MTHSSLIARNRSTAIAPEGDRPTGGGAACVEIVGFPQVLYMRTFGEPDTLFVPLLDATREAFGLIERLSSGGEERANAVSLCGMHLASSLLRDPSFSLGARGLSPDNAYTVDFEAGTLHLVARLYSMVNQRTSFFRVEIAGNIAGGPFVVRDPVQGSVIMQVEEDRLRQPNFFSTALADECVRAQMDHERFGRIDEALGPEASEEVRMVVVAGGKKVLVALRKNGHGEGWDVVDSRRQERIGALSSDMESHLGALTHFVQELFNK
jgi:hypothetical protein